jgi:hypothetical protein
MDGSELSFYKLINFNLRAISSVGRAAHLHCEGRGFESLIAHRMKLPVNKPLKILAIFLFFVMLISTYLGYIYAGV